MGTVIIGKRPTFSSVPALEQGRHSAVAHIQRQEKWAANCVRHCLRGKSSLWCSHLLYFSDPFKNWLPLLCLAPMNCQSTWCLLSAKTSWLCMAQCTGDNETKLSFLLLRRVWASLFLMFPYFPPSSAWHKSLRASAMERKKKSFQNCPYKSMWICVCTHMEWVYCLEQLSSWERNHPYRAWQFGITCTTITLPLQYLHLLFFKIHISCSLIPGLCYQVPRDQKNSHISSRFSPNLHWIGGTGNHRTHLAAVSKLDNSLLLNCFSLVELGALLLFPVHSVLHSAVYYKMVVEVMLTNFLYIACG